MNGATHADAKVDHLLEYLRQSRGFDFTGYKRAQLDAPHRQAHAIGKCGKLQ